MLNDIKVHKLAVFVFIITLVLSFTWASAQEQETAENSGPETQTAAETDSESVIIEEYEPANSSADVEIVDENTKEYSPADSVDGQNAALAETAEDTENETGGSPDEPTAEDGAENEAVGETAAGLLSLDPEAPGLSASGSEPVLPAESGGIATGEASLLSAPISEAGAEPASAVAEEPAVLGESAEFSENEPLDTAYSVDTGMIRRPVFSGPTVIAQWLMSAPIPGAIVGRDDSASAGAQLLPTGGYQVSRVYSICALAADDSAEIESTAASVNYPEGIALGENEEKRGCGRLKSSFSLDLLDQEQAASLLCDNIRVYNNNLVFWNSDPLNGYAYSYDQVCGSEGLINSGQARLFCGEDKLFYDDPAGDYRIAISVKNNKDEERAASNTLKIMELTMFEADFSDFQYGLVEEMSWKTVFGDTVWEEGSAPTIRNIGNTRLKIVISQNDFGFGSQESEWNISYRARVGDNPQFTDYLPDASQAIEEPVNLGEASKIDFAVLVKRFPEQARADFSGQMTLSAEKTEPLECGLP